MKTDSDSYGCLAWILLIVGLALLAVAPIAGVICIVIFGVMLGQSFQKPPPPAE